MGIPPASHTAAACPASLLAALRSWLQASRPAQPHVGIWPLQPVPLCSSLIWLQPLKYFSNDSHSSATLMILPKSTSHLYCYFLKYFSFKLACEFIQYIYYYKTTLLTTECHLFWCTSVKRQDCKAAAIEPGMSLCASSAGRLCFGKHSFNTSAGSKVCSRAPPCSPVPLLKPLPRLLPHRPLPGPWGIGIEILVLGSWHLFSSCKTRPCSLLLDLISHETEPPLWHLGGARGRARVNT